MATTPPQDDLLVRNAIQRLGVNASVEWTRQCLEYQREQHHSNGGNSHLNSNNKNSTMTSTTEPASFVYEMYLLADFRTLDPKPILPSSISTPHGQTLFKDYGPEGVILQILEVEDIKTSSLKMLEACEALGTAGDQAGGFLVGKALPQGMCALDLTDGIRKIRGVMMEPVPGIAMEMKLGAKIQVKEANVRHGILQLYPRNTTVLGGEVASMNQYPRRLVIMNQMKKRLGLPIDAIPLAGKTPTPSPAPGSNRDASVPQGALQQASTPSNPLRNNTSNIWANPQAAVSAQDAVPAPRNPQQYPTDATITRPAFNPWRRTNTSARAASPIEPTAAVSDLGPQWGGYADMEMEANDLPDEGADWEVLSQFSMDDNVRGTPRPKESPPLIATRSPAKKALAKRLTAPKPISQRGSWEISSPSSRAQQIKNLFLSTRATGSDLDGEDADVSDMSDHLFGGLGGALDFELKEDMDKGHKNIHRGKDEEMALEMDQDIHMQELPPPRDLGRLHPRSPSRDLKLKRRVSPEDEEVNQDFVPNRRRSRSFSNTRWIEEDAKIKVKAEPGVETTIVKKESVAKEEKEEEPSRMLNALAQVDPMAMEEDAGTIESLAVVKKEIETIAASSAAVEGHSYHDAIELISDDDDDEDEPMVAKTEVPSRSKVVVKTEPGEVAVVPRREPIIKQEVIKKEETLLEFDMDDADDFGGLSAGSTPNLTECELYQVAAMIRDGHEVKSKARVHKLGKFSLTTLAVSIPIILLPPLPPTELDAPPMPGVQLEAVLDQEVVELLLEYSIADFRVLVRANEAKAKSAVASLRQKLNDVEFVECQFRGLRANIPVVREMRILSKKYR